MRQIIQCVIILIISVYPITVHSQHSIVLWGVPFHVNVDETTKTASLIDEGYIIDDAKYPLKFKPRKVSWLNNEQERTLTIPSEWEINGQIYTITSIGRATFAGFQNIDNVVIPSTVTSIGDYAFFRSSVRKVQLPETVRTVGLRAFGRCLNLQELNLPESARLAHGTSLYAESKGCQPRYYQPQSDMEQNVVHVSSQKEQKITIQPTPQKPTIQPVASSDVDVNIPKAKSIDENTFAMIIANENYKAFGGEVDVRCALNDGRTFKKYCEDVLGLNPKHIFYEENVTLGKMNGMMSKLAFAAEAYDGDAKFIVYYAGHGIPDESTKSAYLLPVDGSGNNIKTMFSLKDLYSELSKLNAKSVTVFLDACFSGSPRGEGEFMASRGLRIKPKAVIPQGKMVVFSAASGDETAWPYFEKGHGLFTYFLLKKLQETKGEVTYGELDSYIKKQVKRSLVDIMDYAKLQTPSTVPSQALESTWRSMKLK